MSRIVAWYREYLPSEALAADVYAFFSFGSGSLVEPSRRRLLREIAFHDPTFCSPQFADGQVSAVFEFPRICDRDGRWKSAPARCEGSVIGPMTHVGRIEGVDRREMVGVYFRPGRVGPFLRASLSELTDRAVNAADVWSDSVMRMATELCERDDAARIDRFESFLLTHVRTDRKVTCSLDLEGLLASVVRRDGRTTVEAMARDAGVSRQYLSRQFHERIGVGPKLYCRLVRFHAALVYAGCGPNVDWARAAIERGYADQSHMIAEFRQFSGLTPHALGARNWFHPFIERIRHRRALLRPPA
jgi:AraC-like DNA-binding protein